MAGLYIHIPFCLHKCDYCDFVSFVCDESTHKYYADLLIKEMELSSTNFPFLYDTVFIGGGTPSILGRGEIKRIMRAAHNYFNIAKDAEITIECNPGTADMYKLSEYLESGINRISFGLQTTSDSLLKQLARIHSFEDFKTAISDAKVAGFNNINADLMYALPTQTVNDVINTIDTLAMFKLPHISAYSLILEEHTPLFDKVSSGAVKLPDEHEEYQMHRTIIERLQSYGYTRYEISNYAKPGFECKHNTCYWDYNTYIGLGLNAHSAVINGGVAQRHYNVCTLEEYENRLKNNMLPTVEQLTVSQQDAMFEYILVGFRKTSGISLNDFQKRFGKTFFEVYGKKLKPFSQYFVHSKERLYMTDDGLDIQNTILSDLI